MKLKLFKIPVTVTFPFVALILFLLICDKKGIVGFILLFAFLHESGHLLMMKLTNNLPQKIVLSAIGISIVWDCYTSPKTEILISSAGVIVNFLLSILFFLLNKKFFSAINLAMGFFNLLPIASFDGGRILKIILLKIFKSEERAEKLRKAVSLTLLFLISVILILTFKYKVFNFTALLTAIYMLIVEISHIKY